LTIPTSWEYNAAISMVPTIRPLQVISKGVSVTALHKHDTSKDRIYQDLRRSIILGHFQPGQKLNLDELAERHQTSVTPVREAVQMLAQEDLVTSRAHSGYFVTQVTLKELKDLLEMREILELAAVERAAAQITEPQLEELERVHAEEISSGHEEYERSVIENRRFHYLIALASGNQELADQLAKLHDRLARFFVFVHSADGVQERHRTLLSALRSHQVERARKAMLNEITETREITLNNVIEKEGTTWYLGSQRDTHHNNSQ